jgi:PAS domain S-box-containing protein
MDEAKTKEQLIAEVRSLRQRLAELEAQHAEDQHLEHILHGQLCVLDTVQQAAVVTDLEGRIVYWNPFAEELYGWSADEVRGRHLLDVSPISLSEAETTEIIEQLRVGKKWSGEFSIQRRDGTTFLASITDSPILDEHGHVLGFIGFSVDITQRKELEARLREETETVETINRIGQLLSAELDLQKLVQIVTDAATELTGAEFGAFFYNLIDDRGEHYTLYTLSGAPYEAFADFPMPRNTDIFGPTFRGEGVIRLDDVHQDSRYGRNPPYSGMPTGHLPVASYLAVPVISRSGEVLGGLFFGHSKRSVFTERSERIAVGLAAQTAIAMDNARLYQAAQQAIRVRDEFLSLAAHELKTPITSIIGYLQVLQRRAKRDSSADERNDRALHTISEQAARLNQLVNSLFDLSRIQLGQLKLDRSIMDLGALVQRLVDDTQPTLERHTLTLECTTDGMPLLVQGDALRLEQVVQNLLHNAIKYSPNGGLVQMKLETQSSDSDQNTPNGVCLTIADQGMGIPADSLSHIFRRFYRAQNVQHTHIGGVGVGLYVANEIVILHNGRIEVDSTEGQGSTFRVWLPRYQAQSSVNAAVLADETRHDPQLTSALITDANPSSPSS